MATEDYLAGLPEESLEALKNLLGDKKAIASGSDKFVAEMLERAPHLGKTTTFYTYYSADERFNEAGRFTEPGFLVGTTKKLAAKDGAVVLAFKVPSGARGLEIGDFVVLGNGHKIYVQPKSDGIIDATLSDLFKGGKPIEAKAPKFAMDAIVRLSPSYAPVTEFHLPGEHNQPSHGGGGIGGGAKKVKKNLTVDNRIKAKAFVKDVAEILGAAVVIAGASATLYGLGKGYAREKGVLTPKGTKPARQLDVPERPRDTSKGIPSGWFG